MESLYGRELSSSYGAFGGKKWKRTSSLAMFPAYLLRTKKVWLLATTVGLALVKTKNLHHHLTLFIIDRDIVHCLLLICISVLFFFFFYHLIRFYVLFLFFVFSILSFFADEKITSNPMVFK